MTPPSISCILLVTIRFLCSRSETEAFIASPSFSSQNKNGYSLSRFTLSRDRSSLRQSHQDEPFEHTTRSSSRDGQGWGDDDNDRDITMGRRRMFSDVLRVAASSVVCTSVCCAPRAAHALAQLVPAERQAAALYDVYRNPVVDAAFAQGMATGMVDYEREAYPKKKQLFSTLFSSFTADRSDSKEQPVVVELGMGSFPNALFYQQMQGLDIIGIDPNDRMEGYARDSARRAGLISSQEKTSKNSFRVIHGVSEALPLPDASVDALVCTLTLCSVLDPEKSIAEVRRVLKPGGQFLFWEHVLSEQDDTLKRAQIAMSPQQVKRADGCHLDRRTGETIRAAGFRTLDLEYLDLKNFYVLNPTACGIATV